MSTEATSYAHVALISEDVHNWHLKGYSSVGLIHGLNNHETVLHSLSRK